MNAQETALTVGLEWDYVMTDWGGQRWYVDTGEYHASIYDWLEYIEWNVYNRFGNKILGEGRATSPDKAKTLALDCIFSQPPPIPVETLPEAQQLLRRAAEATKGVLYNGIASDIHAAETSIFTGEYSVICDIASQEDALQCLRQRMARMTDSAFKSVNDDAYTVLLTADADIGRALDILADEQNGIIDGAVVTRLLDGPAI